MKWETQEQVKGRFAAVMEGMLVMERRLRTLRGGWLWGDEWEAAGWSHDNSGYCCELWALRTLVIMCEHQDCQHQIEVSSSSEETLCFLRFPPVVLAVAIPGVEWNGKSVYPAAIPEGKIYCVLCSVEQKAFAPELEI